MQVYRLVEQIQSALEIEVPEQLSARIAGALQPHLEQIEVALKECRAFMEHYQFLVKRSELHPESASELMKHGDLLRFQIIEPTALVKSLRIMAEYVALQHSDAKGVEMKRKQVDAWLQPLERLEHILTEYASWLDRVMYTLRDVSRHRG